MIVVLSDGDHKGNMYEIDDNSEIGARIPVHTPADPFYMYHEYILMPAETVLGERMAKFLQAVPRVRK